MPLLIFVLGLGLGLIVGAYLGGTRTFKLTLEIDLPDTDTPSGAAKAVAAVTKAAACGQITPGEAQDLCGVLEVQRRAIELSDIETRLAKLETAARQRA